MGDRSLSILLLEDNPADAVLLKKLLVTEEGYSPQITYVKRLAEALEQLAQGHYHIALLDLSVPDSHGLETVTRFCGQAPGLPVVVLTGLDDKNIALQAVTSGAQDYLVKGQLDRELLYRTIRYAIERGQILHRLRESEQRFRGVFEQTFQAMSLLTPEGVVLQSNQTAIQLNGIASPLVWLPIWETHRWGHSQGSQETIRQAVMAAASGEVVQFESQILNAEGHLVWVDCSIKPIANEQETVVFLIAEARDISDRKQAEAEMQKALEKERELNQMKSRFVSMVSHEFRTPMSVIQTAAELLERFELPAAKQEQYFQQIRGSIDTMRQLLDEVLLLGHTESGRFEYIPVLLELNDFCQELVDMARANLSPQHDLQYSYSGTDAVVEVDRVLLQHILLNLLSNAIKYSPAGGIVHFGVHCKEDQVIFCIQDQGIGIPLQDQARLFESFYRGSNTKHIQGTGLGLAIVKNCVDLHGGQIEVASQEEKGTTITVQLPVRIAG